MSEILDCSQVVKTIHSLLYESYFVCFVFGKYHSYFGQENNPEKFSRLLLMVKLAITNSVNPCKSRKCLVQRNLQIFHVTNNMNFPVHVTAFC